MAKRDEPEPRPPKKPIEPKVVTPPPVPLSTFKGDLAHLDEAVTTPEPLSTFKGDLAHLRKRLTGPGVEIRGVDVRDVLVDLMDLLSQNQRRIP